MEGLDFPGPFDGFSLDTKVGEEEELSSAAEFLLSGAGMGSEGESPDTSATPPTPTLQEEPDGTPRRPNLTANGDSVCKHCGKSFNSVWYLKQHAVKHSTERPFKCKFCHKTYRFRSNLYQHKCPDRDIFMGQRAARGLGPRGGRRKNSSSASGANGKSPVARMSSISERAIVTMPKDVLPSPSKGSARATLDLDPWSSAEVKEERKDLDLEMGLTEGQVEEYIVKFRTKLHRCPKCRLFFPTREHLMRHLASHSDVDGRFQCPQCSESFGGEREFGLHKTRHTAGAPHVCARCQGAFISSLALRRHACLCHSERSATSPAQPLSFIDQSPPHPSAAADDLTHPDPPVNGTDRSPFCDAWPEAPMSSGDAHPPEEPRHSPSDSMELGAFDSGYSSSASSDPSPLKLRRLSLGRVDSESSQDSLWDEEEEGPSSGGGVSVSPSIRPHSFRPLRKMEARPLSDSPLAARRVLGLANATEGGVVPIQRLLPLFLPPKPLSASKACPKCGKTLESEQSLRRHLLWHSRGSGPP